jgi:hypothetical protein
MLRRINISAAIIVLICFFLPWVQVSCGGAKDTLTGFELARDETVLLWLIPVLMLATIGFSLLRARKEPRNVDAILSAVCAAVAVLLMNRERVRVNDHAALIAAQLTGWFWLSLISALAIVAASIGSFLRRRKPES